MFDDHGPLASHAQPPTRSHPPPARPGPLPTEPCGVRTAVLTFLASGPHRTSDIAEHLGHSKVLTTSHLKVLRRRGLVVRVGRATYARADLAPSQSGDAWSPHQVRARILAHLTAGPCRARQLAGHLGLAPSTITGYLVALHRRGLVIRLRQGLYGCHDRQHPTPSPGAAAHVSPILDLMAGEPHQIRKRILARLADRPCRARQLAGHLGLTPSTTTGHLVALHRRGLVIRLSRGLYACPDRQRLAPPPDVTAHVPLIRDAILDFLADGPRQAERVAAHIDRTTATATGHLAAMRRRGLVVRLGWGVYARADRVAAAHVPAVVARGHPVRDRVLACLSTKETRSHNDVARRADREPDRVLDHLRALVRAGLAQEVAPKCFRRSSPAPVPAASPPA